MNNNRPPTQSMLTPERYPRPARQPQWGTQGWSWRPGPVPFAVVCTIVLIATTACGASHSPSSTSKNRVVFDQTVSANLVTPAFILTGSQQTLTWSCSPGGTASLIIYMGAVGSSPADAQPIFKNECPLSSTSGTDTLHMPPGSYFLRFLPGGSWHIILTDIDYSASTATAIARHPIPTVTPDPTPPAFSPSVGYQSAWGAHAASAVYSMVLNSTDTFIPNAVSPDGTMLLGNEKIVSNNPTASVTFQGGYYDLATRHFTAIGVSDGGDPVQCCMSDGRYLIAIDSTEPGAPFGSDGIRYWAYDLQTGLLRQLLKTGDMINVMAVSHGLLITSSTVINLATGAVSPVTTSSTTSQTGVVVVTWPYVVYELLNSNGTPTAVGVRNLDTNQDRQLPSLEAFTSSHAAAVGYQTAYSIVGDTLIAAVPSNQTATLTNSYEGSGTTTFYALAHVLSGGTQVTQLGSFTSEGSPGYTVANNTLYATVLTGQVTDQYGNMQDIGWTTLYTIGQIASGGTPPRVVGSFNGDALDIVGANARVIACAGGVWDAAMHQPDGLPVLWDLTSQTFVTFPSFPGNNFGFLVNLAGTDLAVAQNNGTTETVLFLDTSTLPATSTVG